MYIIILTVLFLNIFDSIVANTKLSEEYNMNCTHMLLVDSDMKSKDAVEMTEKMEDVSGVSFVLGLVRL